MILAFLPRFWFFLPYFGLSSGEFGGLGFLPMNLALLPWNLAFLAFCHEFGFLASFLATLLPLIWLSATNLAFLPQPRIWPHTAVISEECVASNIMRSRWRGGSRVSLSFFPLSPELFPFFSERVLCCIHERVGQTLACVFLLCPHYAEFNLPFLRTMNSSDEFAILSLLPFFGFVAMNLASSQWVWPFIYWYLMNLAFSATHLTLPALKILSFLRWIGFLTMNLVFLPWIWLPPMKLALSMNLAFFGWIFSLLTMNLNLALLPWFRVSGKKDSWKEKGGWGPITGILSPSHSLPKMFSDDEIGLAFFRCIFNFLPWLWLSYVYFGLVVINFGFLTSAWFNLLLSFLRRFRPSRHGLLFWWIWSSCPEFGLLPMNMGFLFFPLDVFHLALSPRFWRFCDELGLLWLFLAFLTWLHHLYSNCHIFGFIDIALTNKLNDDQETTVLGVIFLFHWVFQPFAVEKCKCLVHINIFSVTRCCWWMNGSSSVFTKWTV